MTKKQIEDMKALDKAADEAGGYVAYSSSNDVHYNYREILNYCNERNIEPADMTIREVNRFIVNVDG
ncbi:MAG: hypothetical protein LBN35_00660 [Clostridiales Family XIII bacterium]|jgi:hypothetical protein|nr:hypothetical protein [Clostridiales Family XIII bacterium]